jgi:hypothetical protein
MENEIFLQLVAMQLTKASRMVAPLYVVQIPTYSYRNLIFIFLHDIMADDEVVKVVHHRLPLFLHNVPQFPKSFPSNFSTPMLSPARGKKVKKKEA